MINNIFQKTKGIVRILILFIASIVLVACRGSDSDLNSEGAPQNAWPTTALPSTAATTVDQSEFLPSSLMREWHRSLDKVGLRAEASLGQAAYIDVLHERLRQAGVKDIQFEEVEMLRWTAKTWSLSTQTAQGDFGLIDTAAFIPQSGSTPEAGITAELAYLTPQQFQSIVTASNPVAVLMSLAPNLAGKIVLVDFPSIQMTADSFLNKAVSVYDPSGTVKPDDPYERTYLGIGPFLELMDGLELIGVRGIVATYDQAHSSQFAKLFIPNDDHVRGMPGVYVDAIAGQQLRDLAESDGSVTLTLDAIVETINTRNLIGTIPGASDELVVISSHTGGTNGAEGNGPNAIVDIAQYLTRLPQEELERSITIVLSSGHFAGSKGIQGYLRQHKRDGLLDRIAAVITLEHLGLKEWLPDGQGQFFATGKHEPGTMFMPQNAVLQDLSQNWAQNADASPTYFMPPANPRDATWPYMGQYLWGTSNIPVINYITRPAYLLNWGIDTIEFVDFDLMHRQTVAFTQLALDLTRVPLAHLPQRKSSLAQSTQPAHGPGGSDYKSIDVRVSEGGSGSDAWYVFEPVEPMPVSAPLVIMLHGYFEFAGYQSLREFIWHTVRQGNVVIYPRWQTASAVPCQGPLYIEPCMASAVTGIKDAIAFLQADSSRVWPDLDRTSYFGFSFGGILTSNIANRWDSLGLPKPLSIFLDDPHDGGFAGPGEPALDNSLAGIPTTTLFQCHSSQTGVIAANPANSCNAIFPLLNHIPIENKDLVLIYTDTHGNPELGSGHGVCKAEPGAADAYDYNFCWKVFDALRSCAYGNVDCEYALGDTKEHRFNGSWEDGKEIMPLKIQDAAPIDASPISKEAGGS
ncbi:hypothetical protein [Marinobacter sediminicola]|uniref:hypothetical protein n=1 Tax=Marinobacter sediminicola TaxID=3072994 RepID=UPI0028113F65|nr:hypothetical protein [Marinobacter sp. F26243]